MSLRACRRFQIEVISATEYDVVVYANIALSADAEPVKLSNYVTTLPETHSIAIFIGAMARGEDSFADEVVDQKISISKYSLSASVACGKFCCAIVSTSGLVEW